MNEKINSDSKFKTWDAKHKTAVADASRRLNEFETTNASSKETIKTNLKSI